MGREDRERKVLLGLVEYFIQTGKPVGSNTLKEAGFEDLSSATIRNYFAHLEENGYLTQSHSSGGRIPTHLAYRMYTNTYLDHDPVKLKDDIFQNLRVFDRREIASFLQEGAEALGKASMCAVFLSAPRFDHDYVVDIKLILLDAMRCLCVLMTDFGVVKTEVLYLPKRMSSFSIKRMEAYFQWRLKGGEQPKNLNLEEEALGQTFYNELMLRYIVGYSNFIDEDLYRTGFSNLLTYPEFQDAGLLASGLALFENTHSMRLILKECKSLDRLKVWIGDDLAMYVSNPNCTVMSIPYYINHHPVGAIGLLGPVRLPYRTLFSLLRHFSDSISESLTRNIYKFKINFRQPNPEKIYLQNEESKLLGQSRPILLEDKRLE